MSLTVPAVAFRAFAFLCAMTVLAAGCSPGQPKADSRSPFYRQGMALREKGRYEEAAVAFERGLRRAPESVLAHLQLGILYEDHLDRPIEALYHYQQYIRKDGPNEAMARESLDVLCEGLARQWGLSCPHQEDPAAADSPEKEKAADNEEDETGGWTPSVFRPAPPPAASRSMADPGALSPYLAFDPAGAFLSLLASNAEEETHSPGRARPREADVRADYVERIEELKSEVERLTAELDASSEVADGLRRTVKELSKRLQELQRRHSREGPQTAPPSPTGVAAADGADDDAPPWLTYVVQSGDTLSGIARRFYGRSSDWHRIVEWNEDRIEDSDRLKPGTELRLSSDGMDAESRGALREAAEPETSSD